MVQIVGFEADVTGLAAFAAMCWCGTLFAIFQNRQARSRARCALRTQVRLPFPPRTIATFRANGAIVVRLEPLERSDIRALVRRGLRAEAMTANDDATELLIERAGGDGRQVLTALEVACALATKTDHVTLDHVESALGTSALRYGRDDHYDVVSAFIKSMRGSDPNAAVYWLARMLSAGEDVRFVARRMVIFASEDIGMADPQALTIAVSAASAVDVVGMPEAQLNLAEAAIYLASAPKGNAVAQAIWSAMSDIQNGVVGEVPAHLRDAHYASAAEIGHGEGYVSPHDDPSSAQHLEYLPETLSERRWYRPEGGGSS